MENQFSQFDPLKNMQANPITAQDSMANVNKPNPYVIVESEDKRDNNDPQKEVVFKYPKSKIFVGGLDFKLTNEDLKQHFL